MLNIIDLGRTRVFFMFHYEVDEGWERGERLKGRERSPVERSGIIRT